MRKTFSRLLTAFCLILGSLFAVSAFSTSVFAEPGDTFLNQPLTVPNPDNLTQTVDPTLNAPTPSDSETDTDPAEVTPDDTTSDEETSNGETSDEEAEEEQPEEERSVCSNETGGLSWIVCLSGKVVAQATDVIYSIVEDLLQINPATLEESSPIYIVWQCARNLTNIVFIIFLLIVIYSQLTGLGLSNYGIKRVLPRLIIAIILVNLSFIICLIAVDLSNILGASLRSFFGSIETTALAESTVEAGSISFGSILTWLTVGGSLAAGTVALAATNGLSSIFWMALVAVFGAVVAVITGLITIAARQALVALLIMISPLAFVAYLLPNTERWFTKWKDLLLRMLIFYPMFSLLFSASHLAGMAIMASAAGESAALWTILGLAVQIFPLFFSWQLLKMSGTILGAISSGVSRALSPVQRGFSGWAGSHAEERRQHYLANSSLPGARLRRYLDYRQKLRTADTMNSASVRSSLATERAMKALSSSTGRDSAGNDTWRKRANRYTRNAKRSSVEALRAQTAELSHANTISAYKFDSDDRDKRLGKASGQAYLEYSVQKYREANEAQADQTWLLNQYLDAANNLGSYEYNRLIRNGAGSLGHLGESSIMGQVIVKNSEIEERRRREGRIVFTKFGMSKHKAEFRGMIFDTERINDDGFEVDENGKVIQNEQYRFLPGTEHTPWQRFIAVHKKTNAEITAAEYNALSEAEQNNYKKVGYFDITNDQGKPVQRVYSDDAGYMKELLTDDIAIGDPINQRYQLEMGISKTPDQKDGLLRSYASTITAAFAPAGYKEHDASVTAQLTSQLRSGHVNTIGQLYIAKLDSIKNATKPGAFLTNDKFFQEQLQNLFLAGIDDKQFSKMISDQDIELYANVNGEGLHGATWVTDPDGKNGRWRKVPRSEATLEQRKDFIKHMLIPAVARKTFGMINRKPSPTIADSQKPDALEALQGLLGTIMTLQNTNTDPTITDPRQRLNPDINLYKGGDPNSLYNMIQKLHLTDIPPDNDDDDYYGGGNGGQPRSPRSGGGNGGDSFASTSGRYNNVGGQFGRSHAHLNRIRNQNDPLEIEEQIDDIFKLDSFSQISTGLLDLFDVYHTLRRGQDDLRSIIDHYHMAIQPGSSLHEGSNIDLLEQFAHEVKTLVNHCLFGD